MEYVLPIADHDMWQRLDYFTQGYIEALFFTSQQDGDNDGIPDDKTTSDLADETLDQIKRDCAAFQIAYRDLLDQAYDKVGYSSEKAGRDFWYTRNGHGVGFWDRDLGKVGESLSAACGFGTAFTGKDVYMGDDGQIYLG